MKILITSIDYNYIDMTSLYNLYSETLNQLIGIDVYFKIDDDVHLSLNIDTDEPMGHDEIIKHIQDYFKRLVNEE